MYSSAVDAEGVPLVIRASGRRCAVVGAGPAWPGGETGDVVDDMTVPEPLEHSVVGVPSKVGNNSGDIVTVSEPIEHSVVGVPNTVGKSSVDIVTGSEPIEYLVVARGPHDVGNSSVDIVTVPDLIEHSGVRETADLPSAGQLMLNSEISRDWGDGRQDRMCDDNMPLDVRTEDQRLSPGEDEAIIVGLVGSAAPWFLTGWADEVEIEFMMIWDARSQSWLHRCLNICARPNHR